jgi:hypothetical protein
LGNISLKNQKEAESTPTTALSREKLNTPKRRNIHEPSPEVTTREDACEPLFSYEGHQFDAENKDDEAVSVAIDRIYTYEAELIDTLKRMGDSDDFVRICHECNMDPDQRTRAFLDLPRQIVDEHMDELVAACEGIHTDLKQLMQKFLVNKIKMIY